MFAILSIVLLLISLFLCYLLSISDKRSLLYFPFLILFAISLASGVVFYKKFIETKNIRVINNIEANSEAMYLDNIIEEDKENMELKIELEKLNRKLDYLITK